MRLSPQQTEMLALFGKKAGEWRNDSSRTLPFGTPEQVMQEVREAIDIAAPGGGFVLASDHSLHDGIPLENILALKQAGLLFGQPTSA